MLVGFAFVVVLSAFSSAAETGVQTSIRYDATQPVHRIAIRWEAQPFHYYQVRTTTALGQPWLAVHANPFQAGANQATLSYHDQNEAALRFFRVFDLQIPANLVWVTDGTFTMGSPLRENERDSDEGPQTLVILSRGFWIGTREVTQGEYVDVMETNPSYFNGVRDEQDYGTNLNRPVEQVTWFDATNYCARLTARERQAGRLPSGYTLRLPTDAEWEYACRAGTTTAFHYGRALRSGMANFRGTNEFDAGAGTIVNPAGTFLGRSAPTQSYTPNPWGLSDMHGNVWEWCADWWGPSLPGGTTTDPRGPDSGIGRVIRGGSWYHAGRLCRSANRVSLGPGYPRKDLGFRVVLAPEQP